MRKIVYPNMQPVQAKTVAKMAEAKKLQKDKDKKPK